MRSARLATLLMVAVLLSGCDVVSIYPLYDDLTLSFVPELLGSWKAGDDETWIFTSGKKNMYRLVVVRELQAQDAEKTAIEETKFEAAVVRLAGRLFLDLMSDDHGSTGAPAHIFARIELRDDVLRIGWLNDSWMKEKLKTDTYISSVAASHGKTVITAPTRDLQSFFRAYAWEDEAFGGKHGDTSLLRP